MLGPFCSVYMAVVLPNRGWMAAASTSAAATSHVLLGPLCKGCVIIRVVFHCTADLTVLCRLAASLGGSTLESAQALNAGTPLVQRGAGVLGITPAVPFFSLSASPVLFWIPIGVEVQRGAEYIVAGLEVGAGTGSVHWSLSAELVGVQR